MTKRIAAFALAMAMLMCLLPVQTAVAEAAVAAHSDAHTCSEQCADGTVTWTAWTDTDSLPKDSGHYYLTTDVQLTTVYDLTAGKDITICLSGHSIRSKANSKVGQISGKLTISDCTAYTDDAGKYISGALVGSTAGDGAVLSVRRGATLVLESGKLTGGKTNGTSAGGALYVQGGTTAGAGGVVYMYGGEISGNEGHHGGAICLGGANSGCVGSAFYMYGGTITGNNARGKGGGIYAVDRSTVQIHNGTITGNTATGGAPALFISLSNTKVTLSGSVQLDGVVFDNASNAGLKVNGLTHGTKIVLTTAATDISRIVSLAEGGKQDSWSCSWITANGDSVSMVDGAFKLGHYHGDIQYSPWVGGTAHYTLPSEGNYYLANDILRNTNGGTVIVAAGTTHRLCLNGHTITHRNPTNRPYDIRGTFYLEDCSAYTDDKSNYISGGITYDAADSTCAYGNAVLIQRGGTMTMAEGQIHGFHSSLAAGQDSVAIYLHGANTSAKAVFHMQGGQIHSNSSNTSGAAIRVVKASSDAATKNFSEINISGGKIWGNSSAGNGGAIALTSNQLTITGGTITDNKGTSGAVYASGEAKLILCGDPQITKNNGGNLFLADDVTIQLGKMTSGAKVGVDATKVGRAISTALETDPSGYFVSDNALNTVSYKNNCLYLGAAHEHGIQGGEGTLGWTAWTSETTLPLISGNYYLEKDVQLDKELTLPENVQLNLCLNGKTVTAKAGQRIMAISSGAKLTITDCAASCGAITGGTGSYGGAFNVYRGGSLYLYNGKITGNTATAEGGAVYIQAAKGTVPGGQFLMYGGELTNNTAKTGGAVCLAGSDATVTQATFTLQGGTVSGNSATNGGAIYTYNNSNVTLSGGQIVNNTATGAGGGLYIHKNIGAFQVQGTPVVKDNKTGERSNNIHLIGTATISVAELSDGAQLFVTAETPERAITDEVTEEEYGYFHSDSAYRLLTRKENKVFLEITGEHTHCACFSLTEGCDHTEEKWQAWESATTLPTVSGYYYLLADVQLSGSVLMPTGQDIHICLNGKTVTAAENNRLLLIQAKNITSITDCAGTGKLTGGNSTFGGAVNLEAGGTMNLYGGSITGNRSETKEGLGGAIYLRPGNETKGGSIFNMYGGKITENTGYMGGAVHVAAGKVANAESAQFNLYGGEISGNIAAGVETVNAEGKTSIAGGNGSAIYAGQYAKVTMTGGKITQNEGNGYGGTIYLSVAEGTFTGGQITKNISKRDGGGLYAMGKSTVTISDNIVISNNTVPNGAGGGLGFASKTQVTMTGGTVSGNYASHGGGAIIQSGAAMVMTGGTIENNEARVDGGGVYINQPHSDGTPSRLTIQGGSMIANQSGNTGGGIYSNKGHLEMNGGAVSKNTTANYGAGMYLRTATVKLTGGTVDANVSGKDGGGMYCYGGDIEIGGDVKFTANSTKKGAGGAMGFTKEAKVSLTGGTITRNSAGNAGAIIVQGQAHLTMTGGTIQSNNTKGSAGGVYVNSKSTLELKGGTITGNYAEGYGGGGVYVATDGKMTMTGGTVSGNSTKGYGGGVFSSKSTIYIYGGLITGNKSEQYGGGIGAIKSTPYVLGGTVSRNYTTKAGGGMYTKDSAATVRNANFINNEAKSNGGAAYFSMGTVNIDGGTYQGNDTKTYAGAIYFNSTEGTMKNVKVIGNHAGDTSAGIHAFNGKVTIEKTLFSENKADLNGGALGATKFCEMTLNDCIIEKNETATGTIQFQNYATAVLNNVIIRDNIANNGAGIHVFYNVTVTMNGGQITGNKAVYKTTKNGTKTDGLGAGVYVYTVGEMVSYQSTCNLNGVTIENNTADSHGGAVYVGMQMTCNLDGCTIQNNRSGGSGGGIYQTTGTHVNVKNTKLLANNSAATGSAIYAGSDFEMESCTVTGNKATDGAAVYIAPARYDGHSYANAVLKFGGDLQIFDNEGTLDDLYMDEGTAATTTAAGFGENTNIVIQLHSGILTNTILGKYHYEGGDQHYTITCGDRSIREPEYEGESLSDPPVVVQPVKETGNTWLYIGVGVIALAVIAVIILLIIKKKKPAVGAQK